MSADRLIQFLDHPEDLNSGSLPMLEDWVDKYPFFQTAHLLRVKNIQNLDPEIDKHILNLTAAYVSDRKVLYYLLHTLHEETIAPESREGYPVLYEKDYKESMQENISDTLHKQVDLYSLDPDHDIELIPGLAIDVRKEYGSVSDTGYDDTDIPLVESPDLLEITDGSFEEEIPEDEYPEVIIDTETSSFELEDDTESQAEESVISESDSEAESDTEVAEEEIRVEEEQPQEVYSSEEELDQARYRSFTDWLDIVSNEETQTDSYAEISGEDPGELIKLEIPYDLNHLDPESDNPYEESSGDRDSHKSLIDKFIQQNPKIVPDESPHEDTEDKSADSVKEHESFFTDTLARIYIKQGNYAKAIFAYEKLSLKYPEKSTYFAGQISEIKKLIKS
jgi:hypothetical protein